MKRIVSVTFFVTIILFLARFSSNSYAQENIPLDPTYCDGDYYSIPGEPAKCSRAPNACGNDYDDVNTSGKMPNPQSCTSNPNACEGKPPLCCYEMARTGDFTKCVGYWERLWCPKVLCDQARSKGASDSQCGDTCQCSHAFTSYCGDDVEIVPLSQRISGATAPTNTPTPTTSGGSNPTPTPTQVPGVPTATPTPLATNCETQKLAGNYDCQGGVDDADFQKWHTDFLNKLVPLNFFEYWRRVMYRTT